MNPMSFYFRVSGHRSAKRVDRQELILLFLRIFEKLLLAFMNRDFYFRIVAIYLRFKYNESHVVLFSGQWSSQC